MSGEGKRRRSSSRGGVKRDGGDPEQRFDRTEADRFGGGRERKARRRDDARAGVMAQRAAHLVVENGAPRIVARLDARRRRNDVARMRERDRAPAEGLDDEQEQERNAPEHGLFHTPAGTLVLPRAYARRRRSIRRSCRSGSPRFGVSIILTTLPKSGSFMMRRNGSGPIRPSPIHSCRSTREPATARESLRCKHLSRSNPITRSNSSHTRATFARSYPAACRCAVSRQNPTRVRIRSGSAFRRSRSSSKRDPNAVPDPAVPSIHTSRSPGTDSRHSAYPRALRSSPRSRSSM